MTISDIMWVEKYRPKKISEVINQKDIKGSLQALLKNQEEMPHLLFSGSAGVGKTTMAICISCLLYTSPSPRDRQKSRMPSSA